MLFFIIFLIIPLIEIALFVTIGEEIGLVTTLLLSVLTAIIGASLLRQQGLKVLFSAQKQLSTGDLPLQEIFDGFCLAIAGTTLITPGFFTDFIGFMLLLPPIRHVLWLNAPKFFDIGTGRRTHTHQNPDISVIDVEFERMEENNNKNNDS